MMRRLWLYEIAYIYGLREGDVMKFEVLARNQREAETLAFAQYLAKRGPLAYRGDVTISPWAKEMVEVIDP